MRKLKKFKAGVINNQYKHYPKIKDDRIPYELEIEVSGKVYYRKDGALRKADTYKDKQGKWYISIDDITVIITGFNKEKHEWEFIVQRDDNES